MRTDSRKLELARMEGIDVDHYPFLHERHRLFPQIFEDRRHRRIIDVSAGVGIVARRIISEYPCDLHCNEVDATGLRELGKLAVRRTSFDLDTGKRLPFKTGTYDAVICLATLEHLVNIDEAVKELHRILKSDGRLYISVPNYASLYWMVPLILGRTFHDPLHERSRYEFYAHIRYFTYRTLLDYMKHFGFVPDTVYLPLPDGSSRFKSIRERSKVAAAFIRFLLRLLYMVSARWHQEPVICFAKAGAPIRTRKRIL